MKKIILAALSLVAMSGYAADDKKIIKQSKGSITFVVDEFLESINKRNQHFDGNRIAKFMMNDEKISTDHHGLVATSFANEKNLLNLGRDAFYRCIVQAYANHQSLVLSPDMIWLLISQGFARYVNAHAEEMRSKLVSHEGKQTLIVITDRNLFEAEWP